MSPKKMEVPLVMDQFSLTEFFFRLVEPEDKPGVEPGTLSVAFGIAHMDLPAPHRLVLKVHHAFKHPDGAVFEVKASIVGFFKMSSSTPPNEGDALLKRNGLSMLYGALRGLVLPFSGAFPPGVRCILPTVNMIQVVDDAEGEVKKHGVTEAPAPYSPQKKQLRKERPKKSIKGARNGR